MSGIVSLHIPHTLTGMGSSRNVSSLVREIKPSNILIITDRNIAGAGLIDNVKLSLEEAGYLFSIFSGCQPDAPSSVVDGCSQVVREGNYDLLIGIGGGSTMDTTKVASVLAPDGLTFQDFMSGREYSRTLPVILIPTTAGTGSEWDEGAVVTDEIAGQKRWIIKEEFLARGAVLDPEMTLNLPRKVTADTGMDALSHAIESYLSPGANIISDLLAEMAMKLIAASLRQAYTRGNEAVEARYNMSLAAAVAMKAAMLGGASLAHALNNEISMKVHVTHGAAVTILLPHVMQFELTAAPERFARIAELMGEEVTGNTDH